MVEFKINPKDLQEIEDLIAELKQYTPIIKIVLEKALPEIMGILNPITEEFAKGYAKNKGLRYRTLIDEGFTSEQAFKLILPVPVRMDISSSLTSLSASLRRIVDAVEKDKEKKISFFDRFR